MRHCPHSYFFKVIFFNIENIFREEEFRFPWTSAEEEDPNELGPSIFSSTPVIRSALRLACLTKKDRLADLGCGDGRVAIIAASEYGLSAVGLEIDPRFVNIGLTICHKLGLDSLVSLRQANLLELPSDDPVFLTSTVFFVYLLGDKIQSLCGRLESAVRRGSRVVSVCFPFPGWRPVDVSDDGKSYLYTISSLATTVES